MAGSRKGQNLRARAVVKGPDRKGSREIQSGGRTEVRRKEEEGRIEVSWKEADS